MGDATGPTENDVPNEALVEEWTSKCLKDFEKRVRAKVGKVQAIPISQVKQVFEKEAEFTTATMEVACYEMILGILSESPSGTEKVINDLKHQMKNKTTKCSRLAAQMDTGKKTAFSKKQLDADACILGLTADIESFVRNALIRPPHELSDDMPRMENVLSGKCAKLVSTVKEELLLWVREEYQPAFQAALKELKPAL